MQISLQNKGALTEVARQASARLTVDTRGDELVDLTAVVRGWLRELGVREGAVTLFCRHTSASLTVQENADPRVQADLQDALGQLAPADAAWRHDDEGPDDMPAHVKTSLTDASLTLPMAEGRLLLGTWQAIYLMEHRTSPHRREVCLHFIGR